MNRRALKLSLVAIVAMGFFLSAAAQSTNAISLSVRKGPGPGQVTLEWSGGFDPYSVYRGTSPATVTNPANRILVTDTPALVDAAPPALLQCYAVLGPTLVSIEVSPPSSHVAASFDQPLRATGILSDGTARDITDRVVWSTPDTAIATVSNAPGLKGVATGVAPGMATITATFDGIAGSTSLSVTDANLTGIQVTPFFSKLPAGFTQTYRATATFSDGTTADITNRVSWTSTQPAYGSVSNAAGSKGVVTGVAPGSTQIQALSDGFLGATELTVTDATLEAIEPASSRATLPAGYVQTYTAIGTFSDGSNRDCTSDLQWTSSAPTVATVSNTAGSKGVVTGVATGTTQVRAAYGVLEGATILTVTGATLDAIEVSSPDDPSTVGLLTRFTATGTYSDKSTRDLTQRATWTSSAPTIASVSNAAGSRGQLTGVAPGTTNISATVGSVSGGAVITLEGRNFGAIEVSSASSSSTLYQGMAQRLIATATFTDGSTRDITNDANLTWTSSDPSHLSVSNAEGSRGLVTPAAPGTAQITAAYGSVSGGAVLTISGASFSAVEVARPSSTLPASYSQPLRAIATFSDGSTSDVTEFVTWATSDPVAAQVTNAPPNGGTATGVAVGTATITARAGSITGGTVLTVTGATLSAIDVTPPSITTHDGLSQPLTATGRFSDGTTLDVTGQRGVWTSSAPTVATVSNADRRRGRVSAVAPGTTNVSVSTGAISGGAVITVVGASFESIEVAPGGSSLPSELRQPLTATATLSDGRTEDITSRATWTSSAPTIASVSNAAGAKGLVTPASPGTTQITATYGGISGGTPLTIDGASFVSIEVSPPASNSKKVPVSSSTQLHATATLSDGRIRDVTNDVTWTSAAPSFATVSNLPARKGRMTGLAPGTTNVQASFGGVSGSSVITIVGSTLQAIEVSPPDVTAHTGYSRPYVATGIFSDGTVSDLTREVTWTSSNPTFASVSNAANDKGTVTPLQSGSPQIIASLGGVSSASTVTVSSSTLVMIEPVVVDSTVPVPLTTQAHAICHFADGSSEDMTSHVTWSSDTPTIASVSNAAASKGVARGVAPGMTQIRATVGATLGTIPITISGASFVSIDVSPPFDQIPAGYGGQLTATATLSDGSSMDVTERAVWSSSNPAVATVSNAAGAKGVVTAVSAGAVAGITAALSGASGGAMIVVTSATLTTIEINPPVASFPAHFTKQFTATGFFSDGSTRDVTHRATWSSSNMPIATVSNTPSTRGVVTTSSPGVTQIGASTDGVSGSTTLTVTSALDH